MKGCGCHAAGSDRSGRISGSDSGRDDRKIQKPYDQHSSVPDPGILRNRIYGLKVHEKALERGVKVVGATVHFVDEGTDTGPIILQKAVEVEQGDTPEVLQRRVMEQAEWRILPRAIDLIANGKVKVEGHRVTIES